MKHDNFRITRRGYLSSSSPNDRQGHYVHADNAAKAVKLVAKRFPDKFFDVQPVNAGGEIGRRSKYRRDGLEVCEHGDRFILCTFSLTFGCMVEESSNNLGEVLSKVPDHIHEDGEDRISVCEVAYWILDPSDPSDGTPCGVETLYEVQHYADPSEEEDEEDAANVA
jgi:hypothetical protein